MQNLISECFVIHHVNVKYGIIKVQMLIKFNEQLNNFLGKNRLEIKMSMKWSLDLKKLSRIFFQIIFLTKQLLAMTKIHLGLIKAVNSREKQYI